MTNYAQRGLIKNQLEKPLTPCTSRMKWYNHNEPEFRNGQNHVSLLVLQAGAVVTFAGESERPADLR
jgi:hypothetical protein